VGAESKPGKERKRRRRGRRAGRKEGKRREGEEEGRKRRREGKERGKRRETDLLNVCGASINEKDRREQEGERAKGGGGRT